MTHFRLGRLLLVLAVGVGALLVGEPSAAAEPGDTAQAEIAALLDTVGNSDCTFIRNDEPGTATAARAHLERKYRYARKKVGSAEAFIERIASRSSTTGRPYLVECPGKPRQRAGEWLLDRLAEIRGS